MTAAHDAPTERESVWPLLLSAVAACGFGWYFAHVHGGIQRWDAVDLARLAEGRGVAPMQYRYLLPGLVHLARAQGGWLESISYREWESFFDQLGVLATWASTTWLLRVVLRESKNVCGMLALLALPLLLIHYVTLRADYFYVYDLPSVAFFTAGVAASLSRRFWTLSALFVLGTLNRETMLFVALADFAIWAPVRGARRWAVARAVALGATWALIKWALLTRFADNVDPSYSGPLFKEVLDRNIANVREDPRVVLRYWSSVFGYTWIVVVGLYGRIRKTAIGRALWITVPFWALMGVVGLLEEVRIFGELMPTVFAAFLAIVFGEMRSRGTRVADAPAPGIGAPPR